MIRLLLTCCLIVAVLPCWAEEDGFVSLFDSKSLDGWVQRGGKAKYAVENGEIVGTSVADTPNSFLCTEREYADFVLELELKVDTKLNSGIQIRSHAFDESTESHGHKIPAGRVHGYQVEIDPSDRSWSGGVYDEGRRGWLFDLDGDNQRDAREAFRRNDWNHYRIEAVGPSIKTWINGVPVADLADDLDPQGFIALQVHSVDDDLAGREVRWRNIRIKEQK